MTRSRPFQLALVLGVFTLPAQAGYSQYFTWHSRPSEAALRECVAEMRLVVEARGSKLAGPDAEGPPEIRLSSVAFNGIGEEDSHEPFFFPGEIERSPAIPHVPQGYNFCKTAGKPYDEVVTACLLVARDHFPPNVLAIGSDGSWAAGDWLAGSLLYTAVLHRRAVNPMDGEVVPGESAHPSDGGIPHSVSPQLVVAVLGIALALVLAKEMWG